MSSKIIFFALVLSAFCLFDVLASRPRPPLNSNFVNGPWARIGRKRSYDSCEQIIDIENLNLKVLIDYFDCMQKRLDAKIELENSSEQNEDSNGNLLIKRSMFKSLLSKIYKSNV